MKFLKRLLGEDTQGKRDNVILLIRWRTKTGGVDEKKLVVPRYQIQHECDQVCERTDLAEVWVFQQILHHSFPEQTDDEPPTTMAVLAEAGLMMFGKKGLV